MVWKLQTKYFILGNRLKNCSKMTNLIVEKNILFFNVLINKIVNIHFIHIIRLEVQFKKPL